LVVAVTSRLRLIAVIAVVAAGVAGGASLYFKFSHRAAEDSNFSAHVEEGVAAPAKPGQTAPRFDGETIDGHKFSFAPTVGEKSLVVFWASWCPPCAEETPALAELAGRHPDWQIVAVSADSSEREIRDFLKIFPTLAQQKNVSIVWDLEKKIAGRYGITGLPESFLIDHQGALIQKFVGPVDWKKY
jgi:thiol-disulfide isomerase/thioredoxin